MVKLPLLLPLLLAIPVLEIWLLIRVGSIIGAGWTIFFVVFTAFLGLLLVRVQGLSTLARMQQAMLRGDLPAMEMLEGVALLFTGVLLLTPGFFTDAIGFVLLVPSLRRGLIRIVSPGLFATGRRPPPGPGGPPPSPQTLEGEFRREKD